MELTKRQAVFIITICLLSSKVQRLASLVASPLGRHGFLFFLIMGGVDVLMLLICLWTKSLSAGKTTYDVLTKTGGSWLSKTVYSLFSVYFLFNCILPYEAVHDLFGNILFNQLSWEVYSLILIGTLIFVASRGLKNLGRLSEVFFLLIILSFLTLLTLGGITTNFKATLPLCDLDGYNLLKVCFKYNLWFGDFLIIYMFIGKIKDEKHFALPAILSISVCTLFISLAYIIFYGLYQSLSPEFNSLISSISQFSLLDLDIGRVDWFLVLFFQLGAVISSCVYLYLAGFAINEVLFHSSKASESKKAFKQNTIFFCLCIIIYILDVYVFKSNQEGVAILANISQYFGAFMVLILPIILLIVALVYNKKRKKQEKNIYNSLNNLIFVKKTDKKPARRKVAQSAQRKLTYEEGQ